MFNESMHATLIVAATSPDNTTLGAEQRPILQEGGNGFGAQPAAKNTTAAQASFCHSFMGWTGCSGGRREAINEPLKAPGGESSGLWLIPRGEEVLRGSGINSPFI